MFDRRTLPKAFPKACLHMILPAPEQAARIAWDSKTVVHLRLHYCIPRPYGTPAPLPTGVEAQVVGGGPRAQRVGGRVLQQQQRVGRPAGPSLGGGHSAL